MILAGFDRVEWGVDCSIVQPCNLYRCKIGSNVKIGPFVEIQNECVIGDDTVISSHSFLAAGTRVGRHVFIGHHVVTTNDRYPVAHNPNWNCEPPTIEDHARIGSSAVILPGVRIGEGALIGAGAIITRDVGSGDTVIGLW